MKYSSTIVVCFIVLHSCKSQAPFIGRDFVGNHTNSQFVYVFHKDKTFSLDILGGHFSGKAKGDYYVNADTLFIVSWPKEKQPSKERPVIEKEIFLIEGDSCIVSLTYGYDYCKIISQEGYARQSREGKIRIEKKSQ